MSNTVYKNFKPDSNHRSQPAEEINRLALDALEIATSLSVSSTSINQLSDTSAILQQTSARVGKLIPFQTTAFLLVDESSSEFFPAYCTPEKDKSYIADQTDALIENGTFAWALREKRPVIVSATDFKQRLVLHVMTTSSRTRGMFIGSLAKGEKEIPHITLSLLSMVMLNCANALESFELYSMIREINVNLEKKVQERTEELSYRLDFENLISTISATFINLAPDEIDTGIRHALASIGNFIGASHGFVQLLAQDGSFLSNGHQWHAAFADSRPAFLNGRRYQDFPLLAESINTLKPIHIPSVAKLIRKTSTEDCMLLQGTQSLVAVPMVSGKAVIGLLGFDSVEKENPWSEDLVALIKIAGEMFVNALERKWGEAEKKKLQEQLQRTHKFKAIGTLAGGIAHDFNNLLMAVQGNVSLMLMDLDSSHAHYEGLKNIAKQVQSGARLTKQLLGYARKGKYEVKPLDLNRLVEETSATFGRTRKEIIIQTDLSIDLTAIEADEGQLEQVLLNLFVNAADAMPSGGQLVLKTCNVTEEDMQGKLYHPKPGNYVLLVVADTGIGMDKKTQELIFDPFFTSKEIGKGTGLGLASVYGIIKGHNGYIDVASEVGRGTTFHIYLPASEKTALKTSEASSRIVKGTDTILIVDDEVRVLNVSTSMLKSLKYSVHAAKNGQEAIDIYKKNKDKIDLVILDMIMPQLDGGEVYNRMKEINPHVKVLLFSGYSIDGKAGEILKRGCDGFIQKPFGLDELSGKIREILSR